MKGGTFVDITAVDEKTGEDGVTGHQFMGRYQFMFYATALDLTLMLSILEA